VDGWRFFVVGWDNEERIAVVVVAV
jgi:hypothetical protein